jgi:hypothetical protein
MHHYSPIAELAEIVHCQLPDKDLRGFYEDVPSKIHSGEDAAIPPNDHKFDYCFPPRHEEQEANNDLQRCQVVQESWQPEAQL